MEPRFGQDFSHVRVHTDSQAAQSAADVSARAYTVGNNVIFGVGEFALGTSEGQKLIAHELVHTIQQSENTSSRAKQNGIPTLQRQQGQQASGVDDADLVGQHLQRGEGAVEPLAVERVAERLGAGDEGVAP